MGVGTAAAGFHANYLIPLVYTLLTWGPLLGPSSFLTWDPFLTYLGLLPGQLGPHSLFTWAPFLTYPAQLAKNGSDKPIVGGLQLVSCHHLLLDLS